MHQQMVEVRLSPERDESNSTLEGRERSLHGPIEKLERAEELVKSPVAGLPVRKRRCHEVHDVP